MKASLPGLTLSLLAAPLAADQWTVDDDLAADFNDIQPAIDAASAGDTLLIRPDGHIAARFRAAQAAEMLPETLRSLGVEAG